MDILTTRTYWVIAIQGQIVVVKNHEDNAVMLTCIHNPKNAIIDGLIGWCEYNCYDMVDESGDFVFRQQG
jgi:hypothetical protein